MMQVHLDPATIAAVVSSCVTALTATWARVHNRRQNQNLLEQKDPLEAEKQAFTDQLLRAHAQCQDLVKMQLDKIIDLENRQDKLESEFDTFRTLHRQCDVSRGVR